MERSEITYCLKIIEKMHSLIEKRINDPEKLLSALRVAQGELCVLIEENERNNLFKESMEELNNLLALEE